MEIDKLIQIDKDHLWHPYTSTTNPLKVYPVESAEGVRIKLKDGKCLIDGMSSWWSVIHGYNNPTLNKAIENQIHKMAHVMFGGLTHEPAVELAERLLKIVPSEINKIFYADSGSVAVEVAMKMALQYWHAKGNIKKSMFATIRSGYYGDTWHAMSVCDPITGMHSIFSNNMKQYLFVPQPKIRFSEQWDDSDFVSMSKMIEEKHETIAAVILEPIVQGAGGMWFYNAEYLRKLRQYCDKYDILLIFDEIATGFGRTGKMFASFHAGVSPDIMTVGKAITGGYMTFAATMTTDKIAETICNENPYVFMHGPTFMGNPLACAVACASLDLIESYNVERLIKKIETQLIKELEPAKRFENVQEVRIIGAIGVIEMKEPINIEKIQVLFVEEGIWIRPFGKLVYLMPSFIISSEDLALLTSAMLRVIRKY